MSEKIDSVVLEGVQEYTEGAPVKVTVLNGRLVLQATTKDGHVDVDIDLMDIMFAFDKQQDEIRKLPFDPKKYPEFRYLI